MFDVLLVYRVNRFSRSLRETVTLLEELDQAGVAFHSSTEPFDTSGPMGRMLLQLLAMFAQFERARYDTATCDAPRLDADAADRTQSSTPSPSFYRHHRDLIAAAVDQRASDESHRAAHADRRAELAGCHRRARPAPSRPPTATCTHSNRGTLDAELVAERLIALKATAQQLLVRRDDLTDSINAEPSAPDPGHARPGRRAPRRGSSPPARPTSARRSSKRSSRRVIITGPDRLVPVFRIPQPIDENGAAPAQPAGNGPGDGAVRTMTKSVGRVGFEPTT